MRSTTMSDHEALGPAVVAASLGAMLVFYNVTVVAYSLPFIGRALFQSPDHIQVALSTLALVAGAYLAKPLAQAVVGTYADRHGRKPALLGASLLAALTALLLAVLPSVDRIGVLAPILFTVITVLQAAAAGAEWPMLAAYVAESTPPTHRGLVTGFASFNVCAGWLLAILVPLALAVLLSADTYAVWGWRLAFLPAVALGLLSFLLRRRLPESPTFVRLREAGQLSRSPLVELFRERAGTWVAVMLHVVAISGAWSLTIVYPVVFITLADRFSHRQALTIGALGLAVLVAGIMGGGALADRLGPRRISAAGFLVLAALAVPAYTLMANGRLAPALLGIALVAAPLALSAGVYEAWIVSSFRTRYTGAATTCNGVAIALSGTPVVLLATQLVHRFGYGAPAPLLIAVGLLGALTTRLLTPSIHEPLR